MIVRTSRRPVWDARVPVASDWSPLRVLLDRLSSRRAVLSSVLARWRLRSSLACRYTLVDEWPIVLASSASEASAYPVSVFPVWRRS